MAGEARAYLGMLPSLTHPTPQPTLSHPTHLALSVLVSFVRFAEVC